MPKAVHCIFQRVIKTISPFYSTLQAPLVSHPFYPFYLSYLSYPFYPFYPFYLFYLLQHPFCRFFHYFYLQIQSHCPPYIYPQTCVIYVPTSLIYVYPPIYFYLQICGIIAFQRIYFFLQMRTFLIFLTVFHNFFCDGQDHVCYVSNENSIFFQSNQKICLHV